MSLNTEIMIYLHNNLDNITLDLTGTSGNIFDNTLPSSPDIAVKVESSGGFPQDLRNVNLHNPSKQLLVRGTQDSRTGAKLAKGIIDTIGTLGDTRFAYTETAWDSSTTYSPIDLVAHNSSVWVATEANTDETPSEDSDYWVKLVSYKVIKCQAKQPEPVNVGEDDQGRYKYSTNFDLTVRSE